MPREFSLMTKNGLPPAQALMAGTANGADLLGVADQTGTLTAGRRRHRGGGRQPLKQHADHRTSAAGDEGRTLYVSPRR